MSARVEDALRAELARMEVALAQGGFLVGDVHVVDEGSWGRLDAQLEGTERQGKVQIHLNGKGQVRVVPQGAAAHELARALEAGGIECTRPAGGAQARGAAANAQGTPRRTVATPAHPRAQGTDGELVVDCSKFGGALIGPTEWRGMLHQAGAWRQVFHSPRYERGHNNLGEFLALVDACQRVERGEIACTALLSDSRTALSWLAKGCVKTKIDVATACDARFAAAFAGAVQWLARCDRAAWGARLRHWSVKLRGENPADFGRK